MVRSGLSGRVFPLGWKRFARYGLERCFGHVYPSGEFQVIVPDTIHTSESISVVREFDSQNLAYSSYSTRDGDVPDVRRRVTSSLSPLVCPNLISSLRRSKPVVPFALALALDELPREITLD
jgi:hypothetical protein